MIFDEFYQSLYPTLFYQWILSNHATYKKDHIQLEISYYDSLSRIILFQMNKVIGKIVIWNQNIVEEEIQDMDGHQLFYLHYQMTDLSQCCQLFEKFYKALLQYNQEKKLMIALCCSGGLSTSLFSKEIQEVCDLENTPFIIQSLSLEELYQTYQNYDAIFLAPQLIPMLASLEKTIHKPMYCLDTTDFATKNYRAILQFIKKHIN